MSKSHSTASRTFAHNALFAGIACAASLTFGAGSAFAQTAALERVNVQGRVIEAPVRYDVHATCEDFENQLLTTLNRTWLRERRFGEVQVQFVMENGSISGVDAKGMNFTIARDVRAAVYRLDCGAQATADAQIYRFTVAFVNPDAPRETQLAGAPRTGTRIALISR